MAQQHAAQPEGPQPEAYVIACLVHRDWERALDLIEEFGPLPGYAPHLAGMAARLLAEGQLDVAHRLASRAVEMDDTCAFAHSVQGRALLGQPLSTPADCHGPSSEQRASAAEAALLQAAELDPKELPARAALASFYLQQNRLLEARSFIEQALTVAPWDEAARDALKRLRKSVEAAMKAAARDAAADSQIPAGQELAQAAKELHRLAAQVHERCAAARPPTLSLCLIARNEAHNLPRVIDSVRGLATEVIVVDTGSTDDTAKVARRLGAQVEPFTWVDDFAAARNHSLKIATGEWILVLDADDEFPRESVTALRQWLRHAPDVEVVGLYRRYPYPGSQRDSVSVVPRLFRNGRGLRYEGAVHERLVTADGQEAWIDVTLTVTHFHHGIDGSEAVAGRHQRNLPILLRSLERQPDDPRTLYYVGITHYERENWDEAVPYLQAALRTMGKEVELLPKVCSCLGYALMKANRLGEAEATLREGLEQCPTYPSLWFSLGLVLDCLGRLEEAVEAHQAALRGGFGSSVNWHDWDCREARPHLALCDLRLSLADPDAARKHIDAAEQFTGPKPTYTMIRDAIERTRAEQQSLVAARARELAKLETDFAAGNPNAGAPLVTLLLEAGESERACEFTAAWFQSHPDCPHALVARGRVLLASGQAAESHASFVKARQANPENVEAWLGEADACQHLERAEEAEKALMEALRLPSRNERVSQKAGEFYLQQQRWDEAMLHLRDSVQRRDDAWSAWLGLGKAMLRAGDLPTAINCYQRAATLSGGNAAVRIALGEARACLSK